MSAFPPDHPMRAEVERALMAPMPDGLPYVSHYTEFLRITGRKDTPDALVDWSRTAYLIMGPAEGSA